MNKNKSNNNQNQNNQNQNNQNQNNQNQNNQSQNNQNQNVGGNFGNNNVPNQGNNNNQNWNNNQNQGNNNNQNQWNNNNQNQYNNQQPNWNSRQSRRFNKNQYLNSHVQRVLRLRMMQKTKPSIKWGYSILVGFLPILFLAIFVKQSSVGTPLVFGGLQTTVPLVSYGAVWGINFGMFFGIFIITYLITLKSKVINLDVLATVTMFFSLVSNFYLFPQIGNWRWLTLIPVSMAWAMLTQTLLISIIVFELSKNVKGNFDGMNQQQPQTNSNNTYNPNNFPSNNSNNSSDINNYPNNNNNQNMGNNQQQNSQENNFNQQPTNTNSGNLNNNPKNNPNNLNEYGGGSSPLSEEEMK